MGSYSYQPGVFKSHTTGRQYKFDERDPFAKRQARADLDHDDAVAANAARERQARVPPDTRSDAQKARDEAVTTGQPQVNVERGIESRLDYLRSRLPFLRRGEKAQAELRIAQLEKLQSEKQSEREVKAARQEVLESKEVQECLRDAQQLLDDWRFRGDVSESVVQGAAQALATLQETLDVAQWRETAKQLRESHNADRQRAISELRAQQEVLHAQLMTVKADEASPESVQQ